MKNWHVKKGRNTSGTYNLNCLYQHNNIFVMDNHKAAIWSWFQVLDLSKKYNYLHIDRHYDLLDTAITEWVQAIRNNFSGDLKNYTINQLDSLKYKSQFNSDCPVFRFDNFFPIANALYPKLFDKLIFLTHKDGTLPIQYSPVEKSIFDVGENLNFWLEDESDGDNWIVDIDIDYFFSDDQNDSPSSFLTIEFAELIAEHLYLFRDNIEVITIALSPGFCPNWDEAIKFANVFCNKFGFNFKF